LHPFSFFLIDFFNKEIINITALSFYVSLSAVFLSALIGIPLGTLLGLKDFRGKQFVITMINTFMGLPPVVVGLVLYLILSNSGFLGPLQLLYTPYAMILAQFIMGIPIITGLSYSAISVVPQKLIDHAISLGTNKRQLGWIIIKESKVGILAAIVAAFGGAISEVGAIMLVGGNMRYLTRALTTAIVLYTSTGEFDMAISLGIILLSTSFMINLLLTHLQTRYKPNARKGFKLPRFSD
jgi:tungstate transport system permease protein